MINTGQIQIAFDQMNLKMVDTLSEIENNSTVLFIITINEYIQQTALSLELFNNRKDILLGLYNYPRPMNGQSQSFYVVSPVANSMPLPSSRTAIPQHLASDWQLCLTAFIGENHPPH